MIPFAVGVAAWTLAEYLIHRFDGHGMRGRSPFSREHLAHHRDPRLFAPTWKKVVVAGGLAALMAGGGGWLVGPFAHHFTAGFVFMYAVYEVIHRRIHTHAPIGVYGRWARRHHLLHHHADPSMNHGVTSPIWDWVFGTHLVVGEVVVPARIAPVWLTPGTLAGVTIQGGSAG